ncbi:phosphomannomutase/phosphoglucomutase [compost metagenome]
MDERIEAFPCSGEINYKVEDVKGSIEKVLAHYLPLQPKVDKTDGISLEFGDWRFSLRGSNTEPLLRLNVESRADQALVSQQVAEIERLIQE